MYHKIREVKFSELIFINSSCLVPQYIREHEEMLALKLLQGYNSLYGAIIRTGGETGSTPGMVA